MTLSELQIIMEPTGTWHEHLAYGLHEKGLRVVIASPGRVRSFATGMGILTKNDSGDAHVLALQGALRQPEAWVQPPPAIRELKALLKRRDALRDDLQREQNRLEKLHVPRFPTRAEASLTKMIAALDAELNSLRQQIDDHIDNHPPGRICWLCCAETTSAAESRRRHGRVWFCAKNVQAV